MDTYTLNNATQQISVDAKETTNKSTLFWDSAEFNRYGWSAMILLVVVCLGGITMAFGAFEFTSRLILTVFSSMAVLVGILALVPMKWLFGLTALALIIDFFYLVSLLFA